MWWRIKRSEFNKQKGDGNKKAMKKIVNSGVVPGIIAYSDDIPVGWCAVQPRESFPVLENSRILKRIDSKSVWSIVCFFINKDFRRKGLSTELIREAVKYAKKNGAEVVEGYPVEPPAGKSPDVFVYTGLSSAFRKAGFKEETRRSRTRPFMRYYIK